METYELFKKPTVEKVIFQIKFPNLFFLESRIGEYQPKVMHVFTESNMLIQNEFLINLSKNTNTDSEISENPKSMPIRKIWQFKSLDGYCMDITTDTLTIVSNQHEGFIKTNGKICFKDIIELAVSNFVDITQIPKIKRIGLRYIDKCPVFGSTDKTFKKYYNTKFPLNKFSLENTSFMEFKAATERENCKLIYRECLKKNEKTNKFELILDFDASQENIDSTYFQKATEVLHKEIWNEYNKTIKEPLKEHMRS